VTFVIDTSATRWAVAVIDDDGKGRTLVESSGRPDLARVYEGIETPSRIAVATGPGSFTGLRVGVAFGLGLAIGLRIPIIPLPSLDLQAARSLVPATAVIEAGRGRVYFQLPGAAPMLGEPADLPTTHPLVGNVGPRTEAALVAAGHRFVAPAEVRDFAAASAKILETAREVAYGSLEIEYMQSFSIPTKSEPSA
jgi:tRNA threonylcarbamoyladenosine biosynthesis protein TsaB